MEIFIVADVLKVTQNFSTWHASLLESYLQNDSVCQQNFLLSVAILDVTVKTVARVP